MNKRIVRDRAREQISILSSIVFRCERIFIKRRARYELRCDPGFELEYRGVTSPAFRQRRFASAIDRVALALARDASLAALIGAGSFKRKEIQLGSDSRGQRRRGLRLLSATDAYGAATPIFQSSGRRVLPISRRLFSADSPGRFEETYTVPKGPNGITL